MAARLNRVPAPFFAITGASLAKKCGSPRAISAESPAEAKRSPRDIEKKAEN
jgi:hypothetical protein